MRLSTKPRSRGPTRRQREVDAAVSKILEETSPASAIELDRLRTIIARQTITIMRQDDECQTLKRLLQ